MVEKGKDLGILSCPGEKLYLFYFKGGFLWGFFKEIFYAVVFLIQRVL